MDYKTNDTYKYLYGLIGLPLAHSFSKQYFTEKFEKEGLTDYGYDSFPITCPHYLHILVRDNPNLQGLNVTIPFKESVMDFLDELDESAKQVGAVNTILIKGKKLIGYNTDVFGFEREFKLFVKEENLDPKGALILGTGGASKAIKYVLEKNGLSCQLVSRKESSKAITYGQIDSEILATHQFIVNTTPVGTYPNEDQNPAIPYDLLTSEHAVFDLVYNPEKSLFLTRAAEQGCKGRNGLGMLEGQADASWDIWNK